MQPNRTTLSGIWLPLITPFRDGALDETSLRRMIRHYAAEPIDGLIAAATTGEGLTLDDEETGASPLQQQNGEAPQPSDDAIGGEGA